MANENQEKQTEKNLVAREYEKYVVDWIERNENELDNPNIQVGWEQFLPTQVVKIDIDNTEYLHLASGYNSFVLCLLSDEGSAPACYQEWLGAEALEVESIKHLIDDEYMG